MSSLFTRLLRFFGACDLLDERGTTPLGPEPIGTCERCGEETFEGDPRPWACSDSCFIVLTEVTGYFQ